MRTETQFPWLNVVQYPFLTREFDSGDGWMSCVDEGRGRPVVFVHGSMTWSYLFRHLIRHLSGSHRCIAPDHLGFGLSEKKAKADYTPAAHARRFADLMDYLGLRDVTLVVHDAGGPIALSWALDHPDRVRDVVLFNTWMWSLGDNAPACKLAHLVGNPINRVYYRVLKASPTFILPALFADRHRLRKDVQIQYLEPFRSHRDRDGVYGMVESLTSSGDWFDSLWAKRAALKNKPALLLWGTKDPMFGRDSLARWRSELPRAQVATFDHVGRFVPEEAYRPAVDEIRWFMLNGIPASGGIAI